MIIQAGFDLELLARPLIVQEGKLLPRLVVIGLDAEMQLDSIGVVTECFEGSLETRGRTPTLTNITTISHPP